ncbi:glycoside hydrolase family 31 protein [Gordonia rhizosphera]|nr:TIM-barrel domain-containing protein [Gordonia rhizosphera]
MPGENAPQERRRGITRRQAIASMGMAAAAVAATGVRHASAAPLDDNHGIVTSDNIRLTVITPGLIRYEYSPTRRFEDSPTLLAHHRTARSTAYRTHTSDGVVRIDTELLTLTCPTSRFDGGPDIVLKHSGARVRPTWLSDRYVPQLTGVAFAANLETWTTSVPPLPPDNLGGWLRCLDSVRAETSMQPGLLSRSGWHFLDDTHSVLVRDDSDVFVRRPARPGYRDGYIFVYADDYKRALADLRLLSGATPLLPRRAFGNWFSRYAPYDERFYREVLIPQCERAGVALDVLVVDTDFKAPNSWNGWNWNRRLFADPRRFISWAHDRHMAVGLNIHPSISGDDPRYPESAKTAGGTLRSALTPAARFFSALGRRITGALGPTFVWDWGNRAHLTSFMRLHDSFERDGVDFWWLDWIIDESFVGATPGAIADDVWIARAYTRRPRATASRWLPLARNGASYWDMVGTRPGPWGGHRHTIHFTGDTYSTWETLAFEVVFTHAEGNIGLSYVSHDIGGFKGQTDPERYVRWMQFGAFSPIMRIHSQSIDTPRLPWEFASPFREAATAAMRIRSRLVPYLYTAARIAHDTGLPMVRGMYLDWPRRREAYEFRHQYMLGDDLLVAPVVRAASSVRTKRIWFPEGRWVNIVTGASVRGPKVVDVPVTLSDIPVYARAGSTLPLTRGTVPAADGAAPLTLKVFAGASGSSLLYHDDGHSGDYRDTGYSWTTIDWDDEARALSLDTSSPGPLTHPRPPIGRIELVGVDSRPSGVTVNSARIPDQRWVMRPHDRAATADIDGSVRDRLRRRV